MVAEMINSVNLLFHQHFPSTLPSAPLNIETVPCLYMSLINMASLTIIDDEFSENESFITAVSGQIPTDPFGDNPTLQALEKAQTNAEYAALVARIARANRLTIKRVEYIRTEQYAIRKSKKAAWYWVDHGVELIRATPGNKL